MTFHLPVVSRISSAVVALVPVEAPGRRIAKRRACGKARTEYGIYKPVVVANEHALAVQFRQAVIAQHRPDMSGLNGSNIPTWRRRLTLADTRYW